MERDRESLREGYGEEEKEGEGKRERQRKKVKLVRRSYQKNKNVRVSNFKINLETCLAKEQICLPLKDACRHRESVGIHN